MTGECPAARREQAVDELLGLAKLADNQEMKGDLERLAARFSMPRRAADGAELIAAERARQVSEEGWTPEHDDQYGDEPLPDGDGEYVYSSLIRAAVCYAAPFNGLREPPPSWPWDESWWKCDPDPIRNLAKAGALIAAEIDRLQRAEDGGDRAS